MAALFLDPLALTLLLVLVAYVWLVWQGAVRCWYGRTGWWTVLAWPVPLLAIAVPPVASAIVWLATLSGITIGDGDVADAGIYAAAYLAPAVGFAVWPPRWLLPRWARRRLARLPEASEASDAQVPTGALPAIRARRGHGSRARWAWHVDGVAGHVWVDGPTLHFRSAGPTDPGGRLGLDDDAGAGLRLDAAGELRLQPPRGGWWHPGHAEVELAEVDGVRCRPSLPWRRDGLLTVEVAGRQPLQLWVGDLRRLARGLPTRDEGGASGPEPSQDRPA
jgi:hypothetical protein